MKNIFAMILMLALLVGVAIATDTAITAVTSLDGENDYATGLTSQAAPTGSNTAYLAWDGNYEYFVAINTTACGTAPTLNILAGHNPPAFRASLGNKAYSLTNCSPMIVGPLESARFFNETGYLKLSTTNVTTGVISVLKVMR
jgi:hypothetical protein